jgi:hypothetical protein
MIAESQFVRRVVGWLVNLLYVFSLPGVGNLRPCRPLSTAFRMNPNFAERILLFLSICFCSSFIIFILIVKPNIQILSYRKQSQQSH